MYYYYYYHHHYTTIVQLLIVFLFGLTAYVYTMLYQIFQTVTFTGIWSTFCRSSPANSVRTQKTCSISHIYKVIYIYQIMINYYIRLRPFFQDNLGMLEPVEPEM